MLRFEFHIKDNEGNVIVSDYTTFAPGMIDIDGGVETVDIHTSSALRFVRRRHIAGKLESEAA